VLHLIKVNYTGELIQLNFRVARLPWIPVSRNAYAQSVALPNFFTLQKTWFKSATKQESHFLLR